MKSVHITAGIPGTYLQNFANGDNKQYKNIDEACKACYLNSYCNGIVEYKNKYTLRSGNQLMKSFDILERTFIRFEPKFIKNMKETVLLIRTSLPLKKHFHERVKWYASALYRNSMNVWVIIDISKNKQFLNNAFRLLSSELNNIKIGIINKLELSKLYPNLNFECCKDNPLYCYHAEAFNLWYYKYVKNGKYEKKYKYFWFWEDDLAFSGDISKLIGYYKNDKSDLIAINYNKCDEWFGVKCSRIKMKFNDLRQGIEMTRRVSIRLLNYLHERSLDGNTGISEISVNSACADADWCKYNVINKTFLGEKMNQVSRIKEGEWMDFMLNSKDRLFHAMKW